MTPERWQQIDKLFHAALAYEPARRAAFLAGACAGDESLRAEVESLISSHEGSRSFIETPAGDVAAEMLGSHKTRFEPEHQIGNYKIVRQLGSGGMGEVYLAVDTKLGRKVALKLLPEVFTKDVDRVRRFEQEARAASALNHPNILTIHEIHEGDPKFIATEFVDGQTLRQRLRSGQLGTNEALNISEQIAFALAAAQTEGIIHRDVKPENIMLRHDGIVKVLDFGLAKLAEDRVTAPDDPTRALVRTSAGVVMGTAPYMSPEQARGHKVDARTDIFSLGAVTYEMITGTAPFKGETASDVIASILKTEPPLLSNSAPDVPDELERIVTKALEKDREERYQTVKDMLLDLRRLKQRLAVRLEKDRSQSQTAYDDLSVTDSSQTVSSPVNGSTSVNGPAQTTSTASSAEYLLSEIKLHKRAFLLALGLLLTAGIAGSYFLYQWALKRTTPSAVLKISRLTNTGKTTRAAISPDGKYVVYAIDQAGQQSLWLSQVAISSQVQILPPAEVNYVGITFSRDGQLIYYVRNEPNNQGVLYEAPSLGGGTQRKLLVNVHSPITLSPDGNRLAFVRRYPASPKGDALVVANVDGGGENIVFTRSLPSLLSYSGPAWSPDGEIIAVGNQNYSGRFYSNVIGVKVVNGAEIPINPKQWGSSAIGRVEWFASGDELLVNVSDQAGGLPQIWRISYRNDEARQMVNDLNSYFDLSLTADSNTLVTVRNDSRVNIWVSQNGEASRTKQITSGADRDDGVFGGLDWTPDDKIVYASVAGGRPNIWIMGADGSGNKQLSVSGQRSLSVSSDGRYVLSVARGSDGGVPQLWRMEIDGGNSTQLTNIGGAGAWLPSCCAEGKWLVYGTIDSGIVHSLWKLPIEGGTPVRLTERPSWAPVISPDGKLIACNWLDEASGQWKIGIVSIEGGEPDKLFDIAGSYTRPIRWTPDGAALAFVRTSKGVSNIWAQPIDGGPHKQVTDFKDQLITNFKWSRDGKQLAMSRFSVNSDVISISDFK